MNLDALIEALALMIVCWFGRRIPGKPMSKPIRPGETYTTTVVFDLPVDVKNPTLLIQDDHPVTRLIIGHENSPFHKKIRFQL